MKKVLQFALSAVAVAAMLNFQSCDKLKDVVKTPDISLDGASADVAIVPTSDTTAQGTIGQESFSYNLDSMIKAQSGGVVGFNSIKTITLKTITLTLTEGSNTANNFANFSYAATTFNSDVNGGSYDPFTIFNIENNPDTYNVTLAPTIVSGGEDVKKYFSSKMTFYYAIIAKLRRPITQAMNCHVAVTYTIGF